MDEIPRQPQRGIIINESSDEQIQRRSATVSPALYSFSGGPNVSLKGKEKVVEVESKYRGGFFAGLWMPEKSGRNNLSVPEEAGQQDPMPVTVTTKEPVKLKQPFGWRIDEGPSNYERVIKSCNLRFSENLMPRFETSSSILMDLEAGTNNQEDDGGL